MPGRTQSTSGRAPTRARPSAYTWEVCSDIRTSVVSVDPVWGGKLEIATSVGPGWPDVADWEVLAIGAAHAAVAHTPFGGLIEAPFDAEISIRLTDDAEVRKLNHAYRQIGRAHV